MWLHCICCFPQEVQVKAQKVGTLVASDLGSLLPHVSAGEDGCESDAAGRTEEPDLGGGSGCWQRNCSWLRACRWGSTVGAQARCRARALFVRN